MRPPEIRRRKMRKGETESSFMFTVKDYLSPFILNANVNRTYLFASVVSVWSLTVL